MHEVLVNRLGGLSLPRKSVVRLTDRPDMTLDVYRGRKTTIQQYNNKITKEPKQKSRIGTASNEITGGLQLVCDRPTLALSSALVSQTLNCLFCVEDS